MKDRKFHIYLDDEEYRQVLQALIALKNNLIAQGRYTDAVDDVLIKFTKQNFNCDFYHYALCPVDDPATAYL